MSFKFIDSTLCEIDGKQLLCFKHSAQIIQSVQDTLAKIGPDNFFKKPDKEIKRVRESMVALFFLFALQKNTESDWFFIQPQNDPPDFIFANINDNPINVAFEEVELVEIPTRCQTFEEMMLIINKKLKSGYPSTYNLLIFINHEKSKEWIHLLNYNLNNLGSFKSLWTVHLLWFKEKEGLWGSVINRLRPEPTKCIEAKLDDTNFSYSSKVPAFMKTIEKEGKIFLSFKEDFIKAIRVKFREFKNSQNKERC